MRPRGRRLAVFGSCLSRLVSDVDALNRFSPRHRLEKPSGIAQGLGPQRSDLGRHFQVLPSDLPTRQRAGLCLRVVLVPAVVFRWRPRPTQAARRTDPRRASRAPWGHGRGSSSPRSSSAHQSRWRALAGSVPSGAASAIVASASPSASPLIAPCLEAIRCGVVDTITQRGLTTAVVTRRQIGH